MKIKTNPSGGAAATEKTVRAELPSQHTDDRQLWGTEVPLSPHARDTAVSVSNSLAVVARVTPSMGRYRESIVIIFERIKDVVYAKWQR